MDASSDRTRESYALTVDSHTPVTNSEAVRTSRSLLAS